MTITSKFKHINSINTHYHEEGSGDETIILIHGSGPGVSALANWRLVIPELSKHAKIFAPDIIGFGLTDKPVDQLYTMEKWITHLITFIETVSNRPVYLVGNSFGGALALHIAYRRPELIKKLILMGSVGMQHTISPGLEKVWGYTPSLDNMRDLIKIFSYDQAAAEDDDLVRLRYESSKQKDSQNAFAAMFPAPRQRMLDEMALSDDEIATIKHDTLIFHGLNDQVIPIKETSYRLIELIPHSQLHVFSHCGHWTQIEKTQPFIQNIVTFINQ